MKKTLLASLLTVFLAAVVFSAGVQEEKETEKIAEFTVEIRHCNTWRSGTHAARVAAEIRETFEVEPVLSKGSEGSFDVFLNGELIFSKFDDGRFPEIDEINGIIKSVILDNGEG